MGPFHLVDRIVYAPLTRCRAIGTVPQPAAVEYYTQRARQGGFILSEGTSPSATGYGCASCRLCAVVEGLLLCHGIPFAAQAVLGACLGFSPDHLLACR